MAANSKDQIRKKFPLPPEEWDFREISVPEPDDSRPFPSNALHYAISYEYARSCAWIRRLFQNWHCQLIELPPELDVRLRQRRRIFPDLNWSFQPLCEAGKPWSVREALEVGALRGVLYDVLYFAALKLPKERGAVRTMLNLLGISPLFPRPFLNLQWTNSLVAIEFPWKVKYTAVMAREGKVPTTVSKGTASISLTIDVAAGETEIYKGIKRLIDEARASIVKSRNQARSHITNSRTPRLRFSDISPESSGLVSLNVKADLLCRRAEVDEALRLRLKGLLLEHPHACFVPSRGTAQIRPEYFLRELAAFRLCRRGLSYSNAYELLVRYRKIVQRDTPSAILPDYSSSGAWSDAVNQAADRIHKLYPAPGKAPEGKSACAYSSSEIQHVLLMRRLRQDSIFGFPYFGPRLFPRAPQFRRKLKIISEWPSFLPRSNLDHDEREQSGTNSSDLQVTSRRGLRSVS